MNNTAATFKLKTRPEFFDFNFNRKGRGTYDGDPVIFHRGHKTYKGTDENLNS